MHPKRFVQQFRTKRKFKISTSSSLLLCFAPPVIHCKLFPDAVVHGKISNDMTERALYLLKEAGWEMERIAEALGVSARSIERWEDNYITHGCVKPSRSIMRRPKLIWLRIYRSYLARIPLFLTRSRNRLLSIMSNLSRLQPCTWIYKILLSHINGSSGGGRTRRWLLYGMNIEQYSRSAGVPQRIQQRWSRGAAHRSKNNIVDKTPSTMSLSIVKFGTASSLLFRSVVTWLWGSEDSIDGAEAALSSPSDLGSLSVLLLSSLLHHHRAYVVGRECISKFKFLLFFREFRTARGVCDKPFGKPCNKLTI